MKIDWKKEIDFQIAQCKGLFHGIGKDIRMTLALMCIVMPPILAGLWVLDFLVRRF